jgi:hypothetical protein
MAVGRLAVLRKRLQPRLCGFGLIRYSVEFQGTIIDLTLAFPLFTSLFSFPLVYFILCTLTDPQHHRLEFEETLMPQELDEIAMKSGAKLLCYTTPNLLRMKFHWILVWMEG